MPEFDIREAASILTLLQQSTNFISEKSTLEDTLTPTIIISEEQRL
jgi:hypothetical protein